MRLKVGQCELVGVMGLLAVVPIWKDRDLVFEKIHNWGL